MVCESFSQLNIGVKPYESEMESAANSYLMSMFVMMFGLPLPIVNLLATVIFYLVNRRSTYFVRWHCTQALISQVPLFLINAVLFWWTVRVLIGWVPLSSTYFAYLFTVVLFNAIEIVALIFAAVRVRKGIQVELFLFGPLTHKMCGRA